MLADVCGIKDLITQITYFITKEEDILSLSLSSKHLFTLFNTEFQHQFLTTYPSEVTSPLSWTCRYLIRSRETWNFNPSTTLGAILLSNNTLCFAYHLREEKLGPFVDFYKNNISDIVLEKETELKTKGFGNIPNGWRTTFGTKAFMDSVNGGKGRMVGRHYWEVGVVWVNPSYGDFIIGVANVKNVEGPENGVSWGLYYNAGRCSLSFFSKWKSIYDFGSSGPGGEKLERKITLPVVVSVLFDSQKGFLSFYLNGSQICSFSSLDMFSNTLSENETRYLVPFSTLYSDGATLQLLTNWVYPDIANAWLFNGCLNNSL